jgi:PadR family transcriptional regulator PadR
VDHPARVTGPLLDVLEVLLGALSGGDDGVHGWAIMAATRRSGPTVYGVLDRLEDMRWIEGRWESGNPQNGKPRRRLYRLTPNGTSEARSLLSERRPAALRPRPSGWQPKRQAGAT